MKPIIIVGGGVTGLTCGYELSKKGFKVVVIEKEKEVGGLARSFRYGGFTFDIGPHRFYTNKSEIFRFIDSILEGQYSIIKRKSSIYLFDNYFDWPLGIRSIMKLPLKQLLSCSRDLMVRDKKEGDDFKSHITSNYGPTLYQIFFKEYTEKFFSKPCEKLHYEWAIASIDRALIDKKLKIKSLSDLVKKTLMTNSDLKFVYPSRGISQFTENLSERINDNGGKILTNANEIKIKKTKDDVESIEVNGEKFYPKKVIWTAPVNEIIEKLEFNPPSDLNYLSTILYNIEVNDNLKNKNQWIYYGDKNIIFNRISIPKNFNENNAPKDQTGLCVEITCKEGDKLWKNPSSVKDQVILDLEKVRICKKGDIREIYIEQITDTYPIYHINYKNELDAAKRNLSKFKNLIVTGRTGSFYYNNMDDSIEMGLDVVGG